MQKYEIKLEAISSIILSPRMQGALYSEIDYKSNQDYKIIYPFYSFDYRYDQPHKEYGKANTYYIPASSLKGAFLLDKTVEIFEHSKSKLGINIQVESSENEGKKTNFGKYFSFKDIKVQPDQITLDHLSKYQYLYQEEEGTKEPTLGPFFPKVGVERLKSGSILNGELIVKEIEVDWKKTCQNLNLIANIKIQNNIDKINYIKEIYEKKSKEAVVKKLERNYMDGLKKLLSVMVKLEKMKEEIERFNKNEMPQALIFLGGFKGLAHSLSHKISQDMLDGTSFFIDKERDFLHGLAMIELKNS